MVVQEEVALMGSITKAEYIYIDIYPPLLIDPKPQETVLIHEVVQQKT